MTDKLQNQMLPSQLMSQKPVGKLLNLYAGELLLPRKRVMFVVVVFLFTSSNDSVLNGDLGQGYLIGET